MSQGPGAWGRSKLEARPAFHHHASLSSSHLSLETGPFIHLFFDRRLGSIGSHSGSGTTKAKLRRSELPTNHFATHIREQLWCTIRRCLQSPKRLQVHYNHFQHLRDISWPTISSTCSAFPGRYRSMAHFNSYANRCWNLLVLPERHDHLRHYSQN